MNIEEAIQLKNELDADTTSSFNEKYERERPIQNLTEELFLNACSKLGLITRNQIKQFIGSNDCNCSRVDPTISGTIQDDETYKIVTWIDYDMGATWAKYSVLHKPTNTRFRNSLGLSIN